MSQWTLLLCVVITWLTFDGAWGEGKSCKAILSDMTKQQMTMMSKCTKSMKFKNAKEKSAKSMCIMKCVLQDVGMLNEKGGTDVETVKKLGEKFFDSETDREYAMKALTPCMEAHAGIMDPNEEFCKTYEPFVKCLMGNIMNFCPPGK